MNRLIFPLLFCLLGSCSLGRHFGERLVYVPCIRISDRTDTIFCKCRDWAYHSPEDTASFFDPYFIYSKTTGRAVWLPKVVTD